VVNIKTKTFRLRGEKFIPPYCIKYWNSCSDTPFPITVEASGTAYLPVKVSACNSGENFNGSYFESAFSLWHFLPVKLWPGYFSPSWSLIM